MKTKKHSRYQHTPDELFLHVFVFVDDWLKHYQAQLPKQPAQKASYSELLTIALVGEMMAQPFESVWYWIVKHSHADLFPHLPEYSRYYRVIRNAERLLAQLAQAVVCNDTLHVIDSKPLPVAKGITSSVGEVSGGRAGFFDAWCSVRL